MTQTASDLTFTLMADIGMPIRNLFLNPKRMMEEIAVLPGEKVLDFGCGPGVYTFMLADQVGEKGVVYALDVHPQALRRIEAGKRGGKYVQVRTILSDGATSLPDGTLDRVVCFDVFHLLEDPQRILREFHRVLKPQGTLYVNDHHLKDEDILAGVSGSGFFAVRKWYGKTFHFERA
ncbi:MAG: class I SAM-dependent methyltransferase [Anaerolineales bacterium]|nr:class I SAM-dependent methyltransferase [Anaerolineales bacterium]